MLSCVCIGELFQLTVLCRVLTSILVELISPLVVSSRFVTRLFTASKSVNVSVELFLDYLQYFAEYKLPSGLNLWQYFYFIEGLVFDSD